LQTKIDVIDGVDTAEGSFRKAIKDASTSVNETNSTAISSIDTAYKAADATLTTAISDEVTARQTAITTLTSTVGGIETAYKAADATLQSNIDGEASSRQAADITLSNSISSINTSYKAADATLTSAIETEKGRIDAILLASDADKDSFAEIVSLINSVDTANDTAFAGYAVSNDAALAAEILARQTVETTLTTAFTTLDTSYKAADATLTTGLATEVSERKAADAALQSAIDAEVTARQTAITTVTNAKVTANSAISADTGTKITYDAKGLVTSSTSLAATDIPNLDWAKITSGLPTTLSGYGITNGAALSGAAFTGAVSTTSTLSDSLGNIRTIPVSAQTSAITLSASQNGVGISTNAAVTIPTGLAIGFNTTIYNDSASAITISAPSVTARISAATLSKTSFTLAAYGVATIWMNKVDNFVLGGDLS